VESEQELLKLLRNLDESHLEAVGMLVVELASVQAGRKTGRTSVAVNHSQGIAIEVECTGMMRNRIASKRKTRSRGI
jgi:hypothetical protein